LDVRKALLCERHVRLVLNGVELDKRPVRLRRLGGAAEAFFHETLVEECRLVLRVDIAQETLFKQRLLKRRMRR